MDWRYQITRLSAIARFGQTLYLCPCSSVDNDAQVEAHILKSAFEVLHPDVDSAREHRHLGGRLISQITTKNPMNSNGKHTPRFLSLSSEQWIFSPRALVWHCTRPSNFQECLHQHNHAGLTDWRGSQLIYLKAQVSWISYQWNKLTIDTNMISVTWNHSPATCNKHKQYRLSFQRQQWDDHCKRMHRNCC